MARKRGGRSSSIAALAAKAGKGPRNVVVRGTGGKRGYTGGANVTTRKGGSSGAVATKFPVVSPYPREWKTPQSPPMSAPAGMYLGARRGSTK